MTKYRRFQIELKKPEILKQEDNLSKQNPPQPVSWYLFFVFWNQTLDKILKDGLNPSDIVVTTEFLNPRLEGGHECMMFAQAFSSFKHYNADKRGWAQSELLWRKETRRGENRHQ